MPRYGPWLDAPVQVEPVRLLNGYTASSVSRDVSVGGNAAEAYAGDHEVDYLDPAFAALQGAPTATHGTYVFQTLAMVIAQSMFFTGNYDPPDWPDGAVDVDYEPTPPVILGYGLTGSLTLVNRSHYAEVANIRRVPAGLYGALPGPDLDHRWYNPGNVAGFTPVFASDPPLPGDAGDPTLAGDGAAAIFDVDADLGAADAGDTICLLLCLGSFLASYAPVIPTNEFGDPLEFPPAIVLEAKDGFGVGTLFAVLTYQPPRYRFVYNGGVAPPLRQLGRHDGAGAARIRQLRGKTQQNSNRQIGGYF